MAAGQRLGLPMKDRIEVPTNNGPCEIHLVYGSVTKLQKEDEVDVLVISAYPNNYQVTPWSVIGALQRDLGIIVGELARDKEEDLRNIFSCWWSKELPPHCHFNRILCFEGAYKSGIRPPAVIGEIFRSLVSLCKNKDIKVMIPMVATGHQGCEYGLILRLIVEAAIHWMQIGLPLRILKIVAYPKDIDASSLVDYFGKLKRDWLIKEGKRKLKRKDPPIFYDVYLSYSPKDQPLANRVLEKMKQMFKDITVFLERQEIDPEKSWQKDIYKVMISCARVITILSPNFLADESCLEQYNIALCCTRYVERDYLAPFYVEAVEVMPTYMMLIQYIDCRPFNDVNVSKACSLVTNWLTDNLPKLKSIECNQPVTSMTSLSTEGYDVFISYSHRNSDVAYEIKKHIMISHPDWRIFIDVANLKTGVAWQTKLYNSIENSKIILALLSPAYIASKVCQEEYNLALALTCDPRYTNVLFPVLVEEFENVPVWCSDYTPMHMCEGIASDLLRGIKLLDELDKLCKPDLIDMPFLAEKWRKENLNLNFPYLPMVSNEAISTFKIGKTTSQIHTVALIYHPSEKSYATFFKKRVKTYLQGLIVMRPQDSSKGNAFIDEADIVVLLLSPAFLSSPELIEQANIALCRQRLSHRLVLLTVSIAGLPKDHAYFQLFPCFFSCTDDLWQTKKLSLTDRIKWVCSMKAASAICLDNAASFTGFVVFNPDCTKASYKTLLNVKEMWHSVSTMQCRLHDHPTHGNLLHFDDLPVNQGSGADDTNRKTLKSHCSMVAEDGTATPVQVSEEDGSDVKNHHESPQVREGHGVLVAENVNE